MGLLSTHFMTRLRTHSELSLLIALPPRLSKDWVTLRLVLSYSVCHLSQPHSLVRFKVHTLSVCPERRCLVSIFLAYISDRYRCRGSIIMVCGTLCAIGFAMYLGKFPVRLCVQHYLTSSYHPGSSSLHVKYGSLFFGVSGAYSAAPAGATWISNNSAPHTRRATAVAIGVMMSNAGGILVTWLFGTLSPAPLYRKACITMLIFSVLLVLIAGMNIWYLAVQNRKKAEVRQSMEREEEKRGLGDKSAWFIYSL